MTVLRQKASELLTMMPEESMIALVQYMQKEIVKQISDEKRLEKKATAYENLLKLRKSVPELDYEKELAEYREEKFGNAHFS